jgi:hypothetical protein
MTRWSVLAVAMVGVCLGACGRGRGAGPGEGDPAQAARAVEQSWACADELAVAAAEDPDGVARALRLEPARLAPFARSARVAPVREAVAERLEEARANAVGAQVLGTLPPEDRVGATVEERVARSVEVATGLCRSAEALRQERLATAVTTADAKRP